MRGTQGAAPLGAAVFYNHVDTVRALLEAGANPQHHTAEIPAALMLACMRNHVEIMRALIDWGMDVNAPTTMADVTGVYPIHIAAREGHAQAATILIKSGADVNVSTSQGLTPMHYAHSQGHTRVVEILVAAGARLDLTRAVLVSAASNSP